jgi:hypothetical protein
MKFFITLFIAGLAAQSTAAPIEVTRINMFRDTTGRNDINIGVGDRFQYGVDILGGSAGASLGATYAPTGFSDPSNSCSPIAVNRNYCVNATTYSSARTAGSWTMSVSRPGSTTLTVVAPSLAGTESGVPFVQNMKLTTVGTSQTLTWQQPQNIVTDAQRVIIYDPSVILSSGVPDTIHSSNISGSLRSYTLPTVLNSGQSLRPDANYTIAFQSVDTRSDPKLYLADGGNTEILQRSTAFFNFVAPSSPLSASPPRALNTARAGRFNIASVGSRNTTLIGMPSADKYEFLTGIGDPKFSSIKVPNFNTGGDGLYDLFIWNGIDYVDSGIDLTNGSQFYFDQLGVSRFALLGISDQQPSSLRSSSDFLAELSFVSSGSFTGSVIGTVPVPSTAPLVLLSLTPLMALRRKRKLQC